MMNQLPRSAALKIAAAISLLVAITGLALYDLPNVILGAEASPYPYPLVIGSFITDVLTFAAVYGAWRNQKWGAVLLVLVNAFWMIQAALTLLVDPSVGEFVFAAVMMVLHVVAIMLCLWRERVTPRAPGWSGDQRMTT